jgi:hypothetical protein
MERTAFTITLDKGKHGMFFWFLLGIGAIFRLATDKTFVRLDNLVFAADRRRAGRFHAFANAMA